RSGGPAERREASAGCLQCRGLGFVRTPPEGVVRLWVELLVDVGVPLVRGPEDPRVQLVVVHRTTPGSENRVRLQDVTALSRNAPATRGGSGHQDRDALGGVVAAGAEV